MVSYVRESRTLDLLIITLFSNCKCSIIDTSNKAWFMRYPFTWKWMLVQVSMQSITLNIMFSQTWRFQVVTPGSRHMVRLSFNLAVLYAVQRPFSPFFMECLYSLFVIFVYIVKLIIWCIQLVYSLGRLYLLHKSSYSWSRCCDINCQYNNISLHKSNLSMHSYLLFLHDNCLLAHQRTEATSIVFGVSLYNRDDLINVDNCT